MLASCFSINLDKEVTGSIRRDKFWWKVQSKCHDWRNKWRFHPGQRSISKISLSQPAGKPNVLFSPWQSTHNVSLKPFPCLTLAWFTRNSRLGTPINYNPPSMTCLARGKVAHNLLTWDWNSVRASSQSLIGRSRNFSGQSVSDSSCTPSRGASRPSLQSTRRATTSLPNVSNDL